MKNSEILIRDFKHTIEKLEKNSVLKVYIPLDLNSVPKIYVGSELNELLSREEGGRSARQMITPFYFNGQCSVKMEIISV